MNLIRVEGSRMVRPARLAASVPAVAAVTATAGIAASQGKAAPTHKGDTASHLRNVLTSSARS
jgi:hypothetical protein